MIPELRRVICAAIFAAIASAYQAVGRITWDGVRYRKDIGGKAG